MRRLNNIQVFFFLFQFSREKFNPTKKPLLFLTILFSVIALLQTGQDFLHSYLNGYQSYLADSLVFKIYWLLFIPSLGLLLHYTSFIKKQSFAYSKWVIGFTGAVVLSILHIVVTGLLIVFVSHLFFYQSFTFSTPLYYFTSELFYVTLFFYGAGFVFLFYKMQQESFFKKGEPSGAAKLEANRPEELPAYIPVSVQNKIITVALKEVLYIRADRPYIRIHSSNGNFLHAATLKDMLEKLGRQKFVRIHRSMIVNAGQVDHFKSRSNGDYDITLKNGEIVRMSRNYFAGFKKVLV